MTHRTRIKICGVTREEDVRAAAACGADAIGLVFYERSPRFVDIERAAALARALPPYMTPVGLFVNAAPGVVDEAVAAIPNLVLQFHGDETPAQCRAVGRAYLRAVRMGKGVDLLDFAAAHADAQGLLLDAHVEGYGGGGKVFDWSLVRRDVPLPVVLSGGLHAGNVIEGILQVRPWAVDVSSGVEGAKGIKDADAIRRFCQAVRRADALASDRQATPS
jgi:phosphoribosylanthranilate isomerase